jgi:DNA-binding protein HU-beta
VNKNEFISAVCSRKEVAKSDLTKTAITMVVEAVFDTIEAALKKGDEINLVGFGKFEVKKRAASEGRNPRTGETIKIKASKQVKFKAGKRLKDAVN